MPEVTSAPPVRVESIETFLRAEQKAIEKLLIDQEAWAIANLDFYPKLPKDLAFKADEAMSDHERRISFLKALRAAPNIKLALYIEPELHTPNATDLNSIRLRSASFLMSIKIIVLFR